MKRCPLCKTTYPDEANFCPMDAGKLDSLDAPAPSAAPADLLGGRFKVGTRLGGHATGEVYAADDTSTGQQVVVKLVSSACFPTPLIAQRTERELKQIGKVGTDRVARVLDSGRTGERLWLAMEMVAGVALGELVQANGPLSPERAIRLALHVGEALAEGAKVGVIHRDVAPKNVLIGDDDNVKVVNFSLPRPVTDKVLGVPEFLSPEQAEGKPVDQRSNIYSLGALLYFMVTGEPPYSGEPQAVLAQHAHGIPVAPSARTPGVTVAPDLERVILKAMEKQSSKRHLTLRQLLGDLEGLLGGKPAAAPAPVAIAAPTPVPDPTPTPINPAQTMLGHAVFTGADVARAVAAAAPATIESQPTAPAPTPPPMAAQPPPQVMTPPLMTAPPTAPTPPPMYAVPSPVVAPSPPREPTPAPPVAVREPVPHAVSVAATLPDGVPPITQGPAEIVPHSAPIPIPVAVAVQSPLPVITASIAPQPAAPPPAASQASRATAGASLPGGKKTRGQEVQGKKGKFRETMWFKKGELDEAAAQTAATRPGDSAPLDKADELPMEDRYKDDGTISRHDRERLSLKTGNTQMNMPAIREGRPAVPGERLSEDDMVKEMRGGYGKIIMIAAGAVIACVAAYFLFLR